MKKSWLARNQFLVTVLFSIVLIGLGIGFGIRINPFYYLLVVLGASILWGGFALYDTYTWTCSACKRINNFEREKYCDYCGGEMQLERANEFARYCPNGHRVVDNYNLANNCPKCGEALGEKNVELVRWFK